MGVVRMYRYVWLVGVALRKYIDILIIKYHFSLLHLHILALFLTAASFNTSLFIFYIYIYIYIYVI